MTMPWLTASMATSLVKGSSNWIGHVNGRLCMGRSALCSPWADVSPDGGRPGSRSRVPEDGEVISIIEMDVGVERAGLSEEVSGVEFEVHSESALVVAVVL
jgi:hypothetical protein